MVRDACEDASDKDLLGRFVEGRDQRAFELIVQRHGSMVMAAIRCLLHNSTDAEDAFQATFLALAKCAGHVRSRAAVSGWLHRTARRSACFILRDNVRRSKRNRHVSDQLKSQAMSNESAIHDEPSIRAATEELESLLHEEIARLPARLQTAIVLCDLEGLTRKHAAKKMALPLTTVTDHVSKARQLLRDRLSRRGIILSLGGLSAYFNSLRESHGVVNAQLISDTAKKALMYAAGQSTIDVGISSTVITIANHVTSAMRMTRLSAIALIAIGIVAFIGVIGGILGVRETNNQVHGQMPFFDDFELGNASAWTVNDLARGTFSVVDGNYAATGSDPNVTNEALESSVRGIIFDDVSVETQATVVGSGCIFVAVRRGGDQFLTAYAGLIYSDGSAAIVRLDGDVYDPKTPPVFLSSGTVKGVNANNEVKLRLDAVGSNLSFTVWPAGQRIPSSPTLTANDDVYSKGCVGLGFVELSSIPTGTALFRQFRAMPIHGTPGLKTSLPE